MISVFKHIAIILFATLVVIASGGFNLVRHYCACTGMELKAVMVQNIACENEKKGHCCSMEIKKKPACDHCTKHNPAKHKHKNHKCCHTEFTFFKTDKFDIQKSVKKSFEFVAAYSMVLYQQIYSEAEGNGSVHFLSDESPPPLFGKDLLHSLNQLKIADPLV